TSLFAHYGSDQQECPIYAPFAGPIFEGLFPTPVAAWPGSEVACSACRRGARERQNRTMICRSVPGTDIVAVKGTASAVPAFSCEWPDCDADRPRSLIN